MDHEPSNEAAFARVFDSLRREADKSLGKGAVWRFSLVHINQGNPKKGFDSLGKVMDYLRQVLESDEEDHPFNSSMDVKHKEI